MEKINKSFSRRVGRKLRPKQKSLLTEFLPTITIENNKNYIKLTELFKNSLDSFELEIGFGSGEHMVARANENQNIGYIGCEPYLNGVAKALSLIEELNLENIKIYSDDANHIIERLQDHCLNKIWILFPDPWPKHRHHNRRIINDAFLNKISRILANNGSLIIATDHVEYANWIIEKLTTHQFFHLVENERNNQYFPNNWHKSKYQLKAESQGLEPFYFEFIHKYIIN